jgi:hypothetical protein
VPSSAGSTSDSLQLTIDGSTFTYAIQNGNLEVNTNSETDVLNGFGTTVSNLSFRRFGTADVKNNILLTFTLTSKTVRNTGPEVRTFQTTIGLR